MINSHLSSNLVSIYNFTIVPHIHDTTASIIHIMKINRNALQNPTIESRILITEH